jgi:hypothetical protein
MMSVNITGLKETQTYFDALAKGELRFGIAKGLTSLAGGIREKVREELPGRFTLRTKWWDRGPYAIKTEKATKQNLMSRVFTMAPWMVLQEEGGTKTASGKRIAIPMPSVKRSKKDLIRANQKPRALTKAFKIHTKSGNDFLAIRTGRGKNNRLQLMWLLEKATKIKPRFGFQVTAQRVIDRVGLMHINEGIKYALETSKR